MEKYPVISKNGNVYKVKVFFGESFKYAGINIFLYQVKKGIFGQERFRVVARYGELIDEKELIEIYGDYIGLVSWYIEKYEERLEIEKEAKETLPDKFEEWDGFIR